MNSYFVDTLFPVQEEKTLDMAKITDDGIFIPVIALFEEEHVEEDTEYDSLNGR